MHIKQITTQGLKAKDRTVDLDKLNLVFGPNGAGKTALLDAITFAITGSTKLGGTLEHTQQLASPGGCLVTMITDSDFEFDRTISKDMVSRSMKMGLSIKGREELKLKKAEEMVSTQLGNFAPTFDLRKFTDLSPDKRRDFILQLCNVGEKTDREELLHKFIMEYLAITMGEATLLAHLENHKGSVPDATPTQRRDSMLGKLSEAERSALLDFMQIIKPYIKGDVSRAISSALDAAKLQTNGAKIAKDANYLTVRSISERKEAIKTVSESTNQLKERKKELTVRKEERIASLNERKGMQTSIDDRKNQISNHESILDNIALNLKNLTPMNLTEQRQKIDDNLVELAKLEVKQDDEVVDTAKMLEQVNAAQKRFMEAENDGIGIARAYDAAMQDRNRLDKDISQLKSDDWQKLRVIVNSIGHTLNTEMPLHKAWVEMCAIIYAHNNDDELNSKQAECKDCDNKIGKLYNDHKVALGMVSEAKEAWQKLDDDHVDALQEADEKREEQQQIQDEINVLEKSNDNISAAMLARETYIKQQQADSDSAHEQIGAHKHALEELLQKCDAFNVGELESEIMGLAGSIVGIDDKLEYIGKFDQLTQSYNECIKKAEEENIKHEVGKKLCAAIRQVREDIMDELIRPLISRMADFLKIAAPGCRPFITLESDRGKSIFLLGWIVNEEKSVSLPAMSGGESVTFCAALAYAMVELANPPLKLLMLEIGECDDNTFYSLTRAIQKVCSQDQIQAIIATHMDRVIKDEQWNVIRLGQAVLDEQEPGDGFGRGSQKDKGMFLVEGEPTTPLTDLEREANSV